MIAAQSLAPGASPTEVAREHGISSGQLYTWRRLLLAAQPGGGMVAGRFARVEMTTASTIGAVGPAAPVPALSASPNPNPASWPPGLIEIVLPNGTTLRAEGQIEPRVLRRVVEVLRG